MTQIPLFAGITTDGNADFRTAYPVNMVPVPMAQGISDGYLRPADGIALLNGQDADFPNLITNGTFDSNISGWAAYNNAAISHSAALGGRLQFSASTQPELITNGTFNTDISGWSVGAGTAATYDASLGGRLLFTQSTAAFQAVYQDVSTEIGEDYTVTFDLGMLYPSPPTAVTRTAKIRVEDVLTSAVLLEVEFSGTVPVVLSKEFSFSATGTTTRIIIGILGDQAFDYPNTLDNVSCNKSYNAPGAYQDVTTVSSKYFEVTFDMDCPTFGDGSTNRIGYVRAVCLATNAIVLDEQFLVSRGKVTSKSFTFVASNATTKIIIGTIEPVSSNFPVYVDNVECREYFDASIVNRGGINWNGTLYRVIGPDLYSIDATGDASFIGTVGGTGRVRMTYSFDYLAIASSDQLWLYNGTTLAQVTDVDLGNAKDVIFIDGYFMTTDGEFLVVTELNDPFAVDPLKYGSSEINPDPILAILKVRNEAYAMNRYTIEVFANVGTSGFPFQRIPGAQIEKGVVGRDACTVFMDAVVFVGSGYNEAIGVYIAAKGGGSTKISTREIDDILAGYTETELQNLILTTRVDRNHQHLHIRMPDGKTFVFDQAASQALQNPIWFQLCSNLIGGEYRATDIIWCYDQWNVADTQSNKLGYLTPEISTHWNQKVRWEFTTLLLYNEGRGAIVHELELIALTGRTPLGKDPRITAEYTLDGLQWSQPRTIAAGIQGDRQKRLRWLSQGKMHNFRGQRFSGTSDAFMSIARLEARLEPLAF